MLLKLILQLDVIDEIEIRGGTMIGEKGWKIDRITTTNKKTGARSVFPVFTNIKCDQTYKFRTNDVSLPQKSSNKGIFSLLGKCINKEIAFPKLL
jgi:hypothetical protein